jgi:hypothetical protein
MLFRVCNHFRYWGCPQFAKLVSGQWDAVLVMIGAADARDVGSGGPEHWPRTCDGTPE